MQAEGGSGAGAPVIKADGGDGGAPDERCSVLIVGGGLAGLATAVFLGIRGVRAVVVERHPSTSIHPRARGQVPTTMEALRAAGLDQRMMEASPQGKLSVVIAESLARREIFAHIADEFPDFGRYSDAGWAMASQERAEAILRDRAEELGADLRFGTEAEVLGQDDGGVNVRLRDAGSGPGQAGSGPGRGDAGRGDAGREEADAGREEADAGRERIVRADYVVAADGHRGRTREGLGIGVHGRGVLSTAMSIVFEADLSRELRGRGVVLYHMRGSLPGATYATTDDPGRHNVHVGLGAGRWDEARCVQAVRTVTGVPDLAVRLLCYAPWDTAAWVADAFSAGRVFLVGDAARVMPPTGGMGGNSTIQDGYALAWKLAMVVHGQAGPGLLASHDAERRAFAEELVEQQYAAMVDRVAPDRRDGTVAAQIDPATFLFGFRYLDGAFSPAGMGERYENPDAPSGSPGSRLPLLAADADPKGYELTLLTASPEWARVAHRLADAMGIEVSVRRMPDAGSAERAGTGAQGAVLVRPDRYVAWRSRQAPGAESLESALRIIFGA
jgi:putative polyketide hydroxylase